MGTEFREDHEKVLEINSGDSCPKMWMNLMPLKHTLKIVNFMLYVFHCILLQPKRMNTTCKLDKCGAH